MSGYDIAMADQGGSSVLRDYKKGNWTPSETMVLIEAKKMDDERRMKRSGESEGKSKPGELRWKWVEDFCWRKGCHRSQNQCNDKWDNLMRDYKKVRDHERKIAEKREGNEVSYWKMEKNERKEKNLPSNMSPMIYEALVDVVEKSRPQRAVSNPNIGNMSNLQQSLPHLLQHHLLPPPPPSQPPYSQALPTVAQILIQVSIQTHQQQREGRPQVEREPVILLQL